MRTLAITVLSLAAVIGLSCYIRYRYYKTWQKFLDDAAEKLALDFLPGPVKILLLFVLVVWGGAALISQITSELRHKDPLAQPLGQPAPISELAKAADIPGGVPQPAGGGLEAQEAVAAAQAMAPEIPASSAGSIPDLSVLAQQAPPMDPQQMEQLEKMRQEAEKKLEEMRKQQMASLPKPEPEHYFKREKKKAPAETKSAAKKTGVRELAKIEVPKAFGASHGPVLLSRAKAAGPIVLTETTPDPLAAFANAKNVKAELAEPVTPSAAIADMPSYPVIVKTSGKWFEGRLIGKGTKKWTFERPNGDIVSLRREEVRKIIDSPAWPVQIQ